MASSITTEDYYAILETEPDASFDDIKKSYRTLALVRHPDKGGSKEAFQKLQQAYEVLSDETERRKYDSIYPSIPRRRSSSQGTSFNARSQSSFDEAAQIAALQMAKNDRQSQWMQRYNDFQIRVLGLQETIAKMKSEIKELGFTIAIDEAEQRAENSWVAWLSLQFCRETAKRQEEEERKDVVRQERKVQKVLKERQLEAKLQFLADERGMMDEATEAFLSANRRDDTLIKVLQTKLRQREEDEKRAKLRRQQQEEDQRKVNEIRERAKAAREEMERRQREARDRETACNHREWWEKVQGRAHCPECKDPWSYLLECPGCQKKACPKCQRNFRPMRPRNGRGRT